MGDFFLHLMCFNGRIQNRKYLSFILHHNVPLFKILVISMFNHRISTWLQTFRPTVFCTRCEIEMQMMGVRYSESKRWFLISVFQDTQQTLTQMFSTRLNRSAENMQLNFALESLWFRHIHERTRVFSQQLSVIQFIKSHVPVFGLWRVSEESRSVFTAQLVIYFLWMYSLLVSFTTCGAINYHGILL